ncbi:MAG: ComF family protein [Chloroflexi bacterium]|nr:ComF family protein [Chloroflexota bacterium]
MAAEKATCAPGTDVRYLARKWVWAGLDLLSPPCCGGCGAREGRWCPACHASLRALPIPLCSRCGSPIPNPDHCPRCARRPLSLQALRSLAYFEGPLRQALHRLKYQQDQPLAQALGDELAGFWQRLRWPPAVVAPVPLSAERRKERGYNQAELLAGMFAGAAGLPFAAHALRRVRHTASQVGLTADHRWSNVQDAFAARPDTVAGRVTLLVDDVCTTGATLEACAQALLQAGATRVYGLTVGRTP